MKPAVAFLALLCLSGSSLSQDVKVREEAVRLLERGTLASAPAKLPNLERIDIIRVFSDAGVKEGSFSRMVIQGTGRRDDYILGDFHLVNVWTQKQIAATGTPGMLPSELVTVLKVTPIWRVRFDGEDVIHRIDERSVSGHAARCIGFDTVRGQRTDSNEICIDSATDVILLQKLGGETVQYDEFFRFAGSLMPGKITYSRGSTERIEITQTMTELAATDANVLAAPVNAEIHKMCTTYRRAFGLSMPQPQPGSGGGAADVIVRVAVGVDGRVYDAAVQDSERPDLNTEALTVARQWTFTPSLCDGHPEHAEVAVALHFQGR